METNTIMNVIAIVIATMNFMFLFSITKKVEGIKNTYAKSLEQHKIKLQRNFESDRHIIELCRKIDKELIILLSECRKSIEDEDQILNYAEKYVALPSSLNLGKYLELYEFRYSNIESARNIIKACTIYIYFTNDQIQLKHDVKYEYYMEGLYKIRENIDPLLSLLLPKFAIQEKPEH